MKLVNKQYRLSPAIVVLITAACVIAVVFIANFVALRRHRIRAHVEIADPPIETTANSSPYATRSRALPDGEVERTAVRVREVSAMVMGLTLFAASESLAGHLALSVEALTGHFADGGFLPPGIRRSAKGALESDLAVIYVRYRPDPYAIEVVSVGREPLDGPAVIGRIVTGTQEDAEAALFIARQISGVKFPVPFTPDSQVAAMNWGIEPLRESILSVQELEQISGWLRTQQAAR